MRRAVRTVGAVPVLLALAAGPAQAGLIVFDTSDGPHPAVFTIRADGTHLRKLAPGGREPHWSADGRRIAYVSDRSGSAQVWVMDRDGRHRHQVTHDPAADYARPSWSPDGRRLAVSRCTRSFGLCAIDVIGADGKGRREVVADRWHSIEPEFSPDGRRIVYSSDRGGYDSRIWIVGADGRHRRRVPLPVALAPGMAGWSPTGRRLTFTGNPVSGRVFTVAADGRHLRGLTAARDEGIFGTYAPDGRRLVARFTDRRCGCGVLKVMDPDGTHRRALAPTKGTGVTLSDWTVGR